MTYGLPETYGFTDDGHCGHCGGNPLFFVISSYGTFCGSCFRWCEYHGPEQVWGEGMGK